MVNVDDLRQNPDTYRVGAKNKQLDANVIDEFLRVDEQRRSLIGQVEQLRREANELQRTIKGRKPEPTELEQGKQIKEALKTLEPQLKTLEEAFERLIISIPNPASHDTPVGPDESGNIVVRTVGTPTEFAFSPKTHDALLSDLGLINPKQATEAAGSRAYYLIGDLMLLEQAVLQFALKFMVEQGFTPFAVPWMTKKETFINTGYGPWGLDDIYENQDGAGLIGTAEVPLTAYYQNQVLREDDLPLKMVGLSPCFRREIGSYGKDTKGLLRVHNFTKVEQVVYTVADEDVTRSMHDQMLGYAEAVLQALELPYQVLLMCTGDMGAGQRRKYDIETWFPGQQKYRETHSDSYFNDFQARRLNIKYQAKDGTLKYVYTLNNTVAATPRLLAALVENYQNADGTIRVPTVLKPYMGKEVIGKTG